MLKFTGVEAWNAVRMCVFQTFTNTHLVYNIDPEPAQNVRIIPNSELGSVQVRWESSTEVNHILIYELFYNPITIADPKCALKSSRIFLPAVSTYIVFTFFETNSLSEYYFHDCTNAGPFGVRVRAESHRV